MPARHPSLLQHLALALALVVPLAAGSSVRAAGAPSVPPTTPAPAPEPAAAAAPAAAPAASPEPAAPSATPAARLSPLEKAISAAVDASQKKPAPAAADLQDASSPRLAIGAFLTFTRRGDYRSAADFLDLSSLPEDERTQGPELARQLKVVLDQHLWFGDLAEVSAQREGVEDDGQPADVDELGSLPLARGQVPVLVARDPATGRWRFAEATVLKVPALYREHGHPLVERYLPEAFTRIRVREMELWQLISLLVGVPICIVLGRLLGKAVGRPLLRLASRTRTDADELILKAVLPPFRMLLGIAFCVVWTRFVGLSVPERAVARVTISIFIFLAIVWLFVRLIDAAGQLLESRFRTHGPATGVAAVPLLRRIVKTLLFVFAGLSVLQFFGFSITGLLAGVGVVGLGVSLAAQKTLENLFGGVSLIMDQPVRVGDYCKFGLVEGTVEGIGIRSTQIRTLQRTLVSVPNTMFSTDIIENFGSRDRIRIYQLLNLRYETTPDQLRYVLAELRRLLHAHPMIDPDMQIRVRFVGFGASSLDVEVACYAMTADVDAFHGIREDVFLRIMDVVAEAGTGFAFPSQTVYLGRDGGLDAERSRAAEERLERWRAEGRLPFPAAPAEDVYALRGTLAFPPEGSALRVTPQQGVPPDVR